MTKRLRDLRQEAGLSLSNLEALTGVSKAMLGQIEREESSPTLRTLSRIASGLDIPVTVLLDRLLDSKKLT